MLLKIIVGFVIILLLSLLSISLYFTHKFLHFESAVDENPGDLDLKYENVEFKSTDGVELKGWYIPSNSSNEKNTTVLLLHGFTKNKEVTLDGIPYLLNNGYDVFTFDFRGHGESGGRSTLGNREFRDISGAVNYLGRKNKNEIYGLGFSMGASSLILASSKDDSIDKVAVDSAYASFKRSLDSNIRKTLPLSSIFRPFVYLSFKLYGIPIEREDPIDVVDEISPRPIFIIHGKSDSLVDVKNAKLLYKQAKEPKEKWLVDDTAHVMAFRNRGKMYRERVLNFFKD